MAQTTAKRDTDASLALRAAWLHYAGGLTQADVAGRLGVSNVKAHRLIALANQSGAVKVTIDGDVADCLLLEDRLTDRYDLAAARVVPDLGEVGLPLQALGMAGASYLRQRIGSLPGGTIGVGNGRTLSAAISAMPRVDAAGLRFVSLLGGLTRNYAANPQDVMYRLAEKTGAEAYIMPVPFFANSAADREVLLAQRGIGDVVDMAGAADLMIVGIGTAQADAQLVAANLIDIEEIREIQRQGGVGEMLGHFFDRDGHPVASSLADRTVGPELDRLRRCRVVALAGGEAKVDAIRSVLRSGCLSELITDERTAQGLMEDDRF